MPVGIRIGGELAEDLALAGGAVVVKAVAEDDGTPPDKLYYLTFAPGTGLTTTVILDVEKLYTDEWCAILSDPPGCNWSVVPQDLIVLNGTALLLAAITTIGYKVGEIWRIPPSNVPERLIAAEFINDIGTNNWDPRTYGGVSSDWCPATGECWLVRSYEVSNRDGEDVTNPLRIYKSAGPGSSLSLMHEDAGYTVTSAAVWNPGQPDDIMAGWQVAHVAKSITVSADGQRIFVMLEPPNYYTFQGAGGFGGYSYIRSLDGGGTWTRAKLWFPVDSSLADDGGPTGSMRFGFNGAVFDKIYYGPGDTLIHWVVDQHFSDVEHEVFGPMNGVYRSGDDGDNWTPCDDYDGLTRVQYFYPSGFDLAGNGLFPNRRPVVGTHARWRSSWGDVLFHLIDYNDGAGVHTVTLIRSLDDGASWQTIISSGIPASNYGAGITVNNYSFDYDPMTGQLAIWAEMFDGNGKSKVYIIDDAAGPSPSIRAGVTTVDPYPPYMGRADFMSFGGPPGEPLARVADAASREAGELAIILTGSNLRASVYYTNDVHGDGSRWRRCTGAPVRDDGTWIVPDTVVGRFLFGFHDDKIYRGDVTAGVMAATLAPATLDPGDKANHAVWMGGFIDTIMGGCYLIAADDAIYQTWDRGETIAKVRPVPGFSSWLGGMKANMLSLSAGLPGGGGGDPAAPSPPPPPELSGQIDMMIADMTATNQGHAAGTEGYSWENHASVESALPDVNHDKVDSWAMLIWDDAHDFGAANTCVEVLDGKIQCWLLIGATWTMLDDVIFDSQINDPNFGAPIYGSAGSGPKFTVPHNRGVQFYNAINDIPGGQLHGVLSVWQGRLALINPVGVDDRAAAFIIANAGADWRAADPNNIQGAGEGRLKRLTNDYQLFTFTTLSADALRANPPPI